MRRPWFHCHWIGLLLLCFFAPAVVSGSTGRPLLVFAAASLADVLSEVGQSFEKNTGARVRFNFAGSSILSRQIMMGAPADVFFSADEAWMDRLDDKGLVVPGTRTSLLGNRLVLIAPIGQSAGLRAMGDLTRESVERVALADPRSVPAGVYARLYLDSLGLWESVSPKVIPMANVRAALAAVESGNVDAGIVYRSDASISARVVVCVEVPVKEGPLISYPVAAIRGDSFDPRVPAFLEFLKSPSTLEAFQQFGFEVFPQTDPGIVCGAP